MQNHNLRSQLAEIDRLLNILPTDNEVQAHWGRYMCVMVAGFLENALQEVYKDFVRSSNDENVVRYASKQIARTTNPDGGRFLQTAREFNETWRNELRQFIARDGRREAIDSIMKNRNSIAHGGQSVMSPRDVRMYLDKGIEVIDFIENQCLGVANPNS